MTKVIVYIEGKEYRYRNTSEQSDNQTVLNAVNDIIDRYQGSCDMTLICHHWQIPHNFDVKSIIVDRRHVHDNALITTGKRIGFTTFR